MPRQTRKRSAHPSAPPSENKTKEEEIEDDLAAAEEEVPEPEEDGSGNEEPEDDAGDVEPEEELPPPPVETSSRNRRGRARPEATINVAAKGDAGQVRKALAAMTGVDQERAARSAADAREREESTDEDADEFAELLQDRRHMVIVTRAFPKMHLGVRTSGRCEKHHCPITLDTIKEDTFTRFGGRSFLVTIHPNTSTGEAKTIAALTIENPDNTVPFNGSGEPLVLEPEETITPVDPLVEEDPDPMARLDHALNQQVDMVTKVGKIKSARKLLKTLNEDEDDGRREISPALPDPRVAALEKRISDMTVEQRMDKRMEKLENLVVQLAEGGGARGKGGLDPNTALLIEMMKSADTKFQTMMTMFIPLLSNQGKKHDDLDGQLDRLAKLKNVLGDGNPKVKGIEEKLMTLAMERLFDGDERGGTGDAVSDVAKTALKEFSPIAKAMVEKSGQQNLPAPSQEEFQRAVKTEAQRLVASQVQAMAEDWKAKGYLLKIPEGQLPGLPAPQDAAAKPKSEQPPVDKMEEGDEGLDAPPGPQAKNYDRKAAVNFVLDSFITEMKDQKEDGYVIGDVLDRLDDELLNGLLGVSDAAGLEALLIDHADPAKLTEIKTAGQLNPLIKNWLSRMILSTQNEYRRAVEEKGSAERKAAAENGASAGAVAKTG